MGTASARRGGLLALLFAANSIGCRKQRRWQERGDGTLRASGEDCGAAAGS